MLLTTENDVFFPQLSNILYRTYLENSFMRMMNIFGLLWLCMCKSLLKSFDRIVKLLTAYTNHRETCDWSTQHRVVKYCSLNCFSIHMLSIVKCRVLFMRYFFYSCPCHKVHTHNKRHWMFSSLHALIVQWPTQLAKCCCSTHVCIYRRPMSQQSLIRRYISIILIDLKMSRIPQTCSFPKLRLFA